MRKKIKIAAFSMLSILLLFAGYYFTIRSLDNGLSESKDIIPSDEKDGNKMLIPSYFVEGERFYVKLPISDKDSMLGFCDTGGGICMLMPQTINKFGMDAKLRTGILKGVMPLKYILFNDIVQNTNFPQPYPLRSFPLRSPFVRILNPYLIVPPIDEQLNMMTDVQPEMDAFLGQGFFMNKSWTFDYPKKEVWVNTPLHDVDINAPNVQKLGFKKNSNNEKIFGHPSMTIEIDGDSIPVLFDTGATIMLSENGKKQMGTEKKTIGASFIAASIFDKWRKMHPEWKFYEKADLRADIIEVPTIKIGGYEVGPVLFAKRPDEAWSEGMISSMDKIVKGAIGGSALKYLKVTIDYNAELIKFEK